MASKLNFARSPAAVEALYSPTPTTVVTQQSGSTIAGATLVAATDPRLKPRQAGPWSASGSSYAPTSRYSYVWDSPPAFGFAFSHTGTVFELALTKTSATSVRIKVDGQRVTTLPELMSTVSGGAAFVYKVTFATSATRQIQVEGQYATVRGVYVGTGNTIAAPPAFNARLIVAGDQVSVGLGPTYNTGYGQGAWVPRFGDYAAVDDPWNVSITGNTGFITGTVGTTLPERITDVTNWAPDVVIVWNGFYDRAGSQTAIRTAADTYLANLKSALPTAEIYVIGCWAPTDAPGATTHIPTDATIKAAALAAALPFVSPITGNVYSKTGTLLGSTGPWIATPADTTAYVSTVDNIVPTDAGHQHIAEMMRSALLMTQTNIITITDSLGLTDTGADEYIEGIEEQTDSLAFTDSVEVGRSGSATLPVTATRTAAGAVGKVGGAAALAVTASLPAAGLKGTGGNRASLAVTATLTADGRVAYGRPASPLTVTATLSAAGFVTGQPATSEIVERWYAMLPAMYRTADLADTSIGFGRPLYRFMEAILSPLAEPETIARRILAGEMTNPVLADDKWIPWLAQAIGVAGLGVTQQRARIAALTAAPALTSTSYMIALIQPMLTGTRSVEVSATPPWTITVRVRADELSNVGGTGDGLRDAIYATGRVPTGFLIAVTTTQQTWGQIDAAVDQWSDTAGKTWGEVDSIGL